MRPTGDPVRTGIYDIYELLLWNRDRSPDAVRQIELRTPGRERVQTTDLDVMAEMDAEP